MSWFLTEERELIRNIAREFTQTELAKRGKEIDLSDEFPYDLVERCKDLNLLGIPIPAEYGGLGSDITTNCLVLEEISKECPMLGAVIDVNVSVGAMPLLLHGTEEQKQKYLVPSAKGEKLIAFALTEPGAGSDAAATQSTAILDGDEWIINGSKCFITLLKVAKTYILTARAPEGVTAFIAEEDYPGLEIGKMEHKLGMHGINTGELFFRNLRVPKENVLGKVGRGLPIFFEALDEGRLAVAAVCLGSAEGVFEKTVTYTKERVQFNQPICNFQGIQWMLADMATEIECARNLLFAAAYKRDTGLRFSNDASMAKLYSSEMAVRVTNMAIELHGGNGYMTDFGIDRYMRDVRIETIGEGTSQIQRNLIGKNVLR